MLKLIGEKIFTILRRKLCLSKPVIINRIPGNQTYSSFQDHKEEAKIMNVPAHEISVLIALVIVVVALASLCTICAVSTESSQTQQPTFTKYGSR